MFHPLLLLLLPLATALQGGEFVKKHQVPVATASSADPYTCFVDAPNSHATTGCRKSEAICDTGQAIANKQHWNGSDYVWEWECSFLTFTQCGLQWCAPNSYCESPNLCLCNSGLEGAPTVNCYNATLFYSNNTGCPIPRTSVPTSAPTENPTASPTSAPTGRPTSSPTTSPTLAPTTSAPTTSPTSSPTLSPTGAPTIQIRFVEKDCPKSYKTLFIVFASLSGALFLVSVFLLILYLKNLKKSENLHQSTHLDPRRGVSNPDYERNHNFGIHKNPIYHGNNQTDEYLSVINENDENYDNSLNYGFPTADNLDKLNL